MDFLKISLYSHIPQIQNSFVYTISLSWIVPEIFQKNATSSATMADEEMEHIWLYYVSVKFHQNRCVTFERDPL